MNTRMSIVIAFGAMLCGCASVEVSDDAALKGIPFYVKEPVSTQDTQWVAGELLVRFKVTELSGPQSGATVIRSIDLPQSGPLRLIDTPASRARLEALIDALPDKPAPDLEGTLANLQVVLAALSRDYKAGMLRAEACGDAASAPPEHFALASNAWSLGMVAAPKRFYIVTQQPVFGSSTANFKFASDGTMTESNVAVTDDTAKTLLSVLPITSLLTKQWALTPPAAAAAAATGIGTQSFSFGPSRKPAKPPPTPPPKKAVKVDASVGDVKTVYALRRTVHLDDGSQLNAYIGKRADAAPLSLCAGLKGANGIQLISITPQGGGSDKGGDANAWQIQGSVVPPKPAAATAGKE